MPKKRYPKAVWLVLTCFQLGIAMKAEEVNLASNFRVDKDYLSDLFGSYLPIPPGFLPGQQPGNGGGSNGGRAHPLDPLSEAEIRSTSSIITNYRQGNFIFNYIVLREPAKSVLLPYFLSDSTPPSTSIPRRSFAVLLDRSEYRAYEVIVNLDTRQVESWNEAPEGVAPPLTVDEMLLAERVVRANPDVQERCRQLGYPNMSLVNADPWTIGYVGDQPQYQGRRLSQLYLYGKNFEQDNQYAHPFDFLVVVDILKEQVIAIEELPTHDEFDASNKEGNTVPRETSNYDPSLRESSFYRRDLKPVKVSQQGTSFTISGNEIQWQKYKFRVGFNGREGLVLYFLNYNDAGKVRPLFYRMSLAEMFIPYSDPRSPYYRKHVFDEGQYGIGFNANSLKANLDCVGEVRFFDAILHNTQGEPQRIPKVVCVREEDAGILWKHTDYRTGESAIVRSQRLAMTYIATIGNYDYIYTWSFYQDGSIEFNVKLTGILSVNLLAVNATPAGHGSIVFPQLSAQYHQHFFSLRLDAEIDGNRNSVSVSDVVPGPGAPGSATNPYGQAFTTQRKVFATTGESRTSVAPEKSRTWIITNPKVKNPYTKRQVGWKLMPWPTPPMFLQNESPIHPQAAWMDYNTWVTPYKEDQMFPGGYYLNNSGLPEWVGENENANVANTDVVLWHNFGLTHIPRTEDFPVMPVETCGIFLKPYNFFLENPALDVPPPRSRFNSEL